MPEACPGDWDRSAVFGSGTPNAAMRTKPATMLVGIVNCDRLAPLRPRMKAAAQVVTPRPLLLVASTWGRATMRSVGRGGARRDGGPVELRCSGLVVRADQLLVVGRDGRGDWALPGGSPEPGEGCAACVRREVLEESGIKVETGEVAFVFEVTDPGGEDRLIEIVFYAQERGERAPLYGAEPGLTPRWVPLDGLGSVELRPPIAGYVRGATRRLPGHSAPYLGNLWRPDGRRGEADE